MIRCLQWGFIFLMFNLMAFGTSSTVDNFPYSDNSTETYTVEIGQTIEYLLVSEGSPTAIKKMPGKYGHIESYYYRNSHTTYTVNTETGYICNVTAGKHTGSCPPINPQY